MEPSRGRRNRGREGGMQTVCLGVVIVSIASSCCAVEWQQVSELPGAETLSCMVADSSHQRLLIGGKSGYRVYYPLTDAWLTREDGTAWWVYSFLTEPGDSLGLFTGWLGGFFFGGIMDSYGLVTTGPIVWTGPFGGVTGIVRQPGDPSSIFACAMSGDGPGGVYRSLDGGFEWDTVHQFASSSAMALSIAPDGDILVGFGNPGPPYEGNGLIRSRDGGETWVDASGDMPLPGYVGDIAIDPRNPLRIIIRQGSSAEPVDPALGVYKTSDGGEHWYRVVAGRTRDLCMYSGDPDVLVCIAEDGVLLTRDGGESWVDISGGSPQVLEAVACAVSPADQRIYVADDSVGLWACSIVVSGIDDVSPQQLVLSVHPNPFNPSSALDYDLPSEGPVSLDIADVRGRLVRRIVAAGQQSGGAHTASWDGKNQSGEALPSGLYLARLQWGRELRTQKLLLLR